MPHWDLGTQNGSLLIKSEVTISVVAVKQLFQGAKSLHLLSWDWTSRDTPPRFPTLTGPGSFLKEAFPRSSFLPWPKAWGPKGTPPKLVLQFLIGEEDFGAAMKEAYGSALMEQVLLCGPPPPHSGSSPHRKSQAVFAEGTVLSHLPTSPEPQASPWLVGPV